MQPPLNDEYTTMKKALDAHIASTNQVLAMDAPNPVQQETPCLPISVSWDDFLPYIEDVGDINLLHLL